MGAFAPTLILNVMDRLDMYERKPSGMEEYLSNYGWHFSKAMCMWAISMMKDRKGERVKPRDKAEIEELLKANGMAVDTKGYDIVYVYAMAKADYGGSSITDEARLAKFVGDYLSDPDGYDGIAFTRFYADCIAKGIPIQWDDML